MKNTAHYLMVSALSCSLAAPSYAQEAANNSAAEEVSPTAQVKEGLDKESTKDYYAAAGEGKTLPEKVMRARFVYQLGTSEKGYDAAGGEMNHGLDLTAHGGAFVLEYGITDNISVQAKAPMLFSGKWESNTAKFKQSKIYKHKKEQYLNKLKSLLKQNGLNDEQIKGFLNTPINQLKQTDGYRAIKANSNRDIFSSGETIAEASNIEAYEDTSASITQVVENIVVAGSQGAKDGEFSMGDIEVGILYNIVDGKGAFTNNPVHISAGLGLRLPTGKFEEAPTGTVTSGRGTIDLGLRFNADYYVMPGLVLSYQNQTEFMLKEGERRTTQLSNNQELVQGAGEKTRTFEREGVRNIGFLKAKLGLGVFSQSLRAIGIGAAYHYDFDSTPTYDGEADGPVAGSSPEYKAISGNIVFDGLAYHLPFQVDLEYKHAVAGENITFAADAMKVEVKTFYKF